MKERKKSITKKIFFLLLSVLITTLSRVDYSYAAGTPVPSDIASSDSESDDAFLPDINTETDGKDESDTETSENSFCQVNIDFLVLDENGYWTTFQQIEKKNIKPNTTLREADITFPEMNSKYLDSVQIDWGDYDGNKITEDTPIVQNTYMSVYAIYDKNCVQIEYCYPNTNGKWETVSLSVDVARGETYGSLFARAQEYVPQNMDKEYGPDWDYNIGCYVKDQIISEYNLSFKFTAKSTGKTTLKVNRTYFDEDGCLTPNNDFELFDVDRGTTVAEAIQSLKESEISSMYPGLRFKKWNISMENSLTEDAIVNDGDIIHMDAVYENCLIRYIIDSRFEETLPENIYDESSFDAIFCKTVEKGTDVIFPETFDGYEKIIWTGKHYEPGEYFTVNRNISFYAYEDQETEESDDPEKPGKPEEPDDPEKPGKPGESIKPVKPAKPGETNEPLKPWKPVQTDKPDIPDTSDKTDKPGINDYGIENSTAKVQNVSSINNSVQAASVITAASQNSTPTSTSKTYQMQTAENNSRGQTTSVNTGDNATVFPITICSISALGITIYLIKRRNIL